MRERDVAVGVAVRIVGAVEGDETRRQDGGSGVRGLAVSLVAAAGDYEERDADLEASAAELPLGREFLPIAPVIGPSARTCR